MKCNACWSTELEPKSQAVATTCAHLFCAPRSQVVAYLAQQLWKVLVTWQQCAGIPCAQKIFENDCICPVCEEAISKR